MTTITNEPIFLQEVIDILEGEFGFLSPYFTDLYLYNQLIFLNSGYSMRINPSTLTGNRSLTIPDNGGQLVVDGASQDLSNKLYKARLGSATTPSYAFDTYQNTGIFNNGSDSNLRFCVNGNEKLVLSSSSLTPSNAIEGIDGTVSVPSYSFTNNRDTGFYYETGPIVSFTVDNSKRLGIGATYTTNINNVIIPAGTVSAPGICFGSIAPDVGSGLYYPLSSQVGITCNGVESCRFLTGGVLIPTGNTIGLPDGSESIPSLGFTFDTSTGLYVTNPGNELSFTVNGTRRGFFSTSQLRLTVPVRTNDGTAGAPTHSFVSATNTGIFRNASSELALSVAGSERVSVGTGTTHFAYNSGTHQISLTRADGTTLAGTMFMNSSNHLNITANSGGGQIILTPNAAEVIITDGSNLRSQESYDDTTATAANLNVSASGLFARSTSSIKFKKDIEDLKDGLNVIDKFKPITYRNKFKNIRDEDGKKIKVDDDNPKRYAGLIAEDLDRDGLGLFVSYNELTNEPDNVEYSRIITVLINSIQELKSRVEQLETLIK